MTLRRIALAMSGLTFGTIGVIGMFLPTQVARVYGLSLVGVDGLAEFRAVYVGFWISLAITMITAARRPDATLLGDLCGVMLLAQSLGRLASFGLDGRPSWPFIAAFVMELASAMTILAPRFLARRPAAPGSAYAKAAARLSI